MELPEYHELVLILDTFDPSRPYVREVVDPELVDLTIWDSRKLVSHAHGSIKGVAHYLIAHQNELARIVDAYGDCNYAANQLAAGMVETMHQKLEDAINNRKTLRMQQAAPELAPIDPTNEDKSSEY